MVNKNSISEAKFDFKNYIIDKAPETRTVTIPETGDEFEVMIKDLSWSKRNQLISKGKNFKISLMVLLSIIYLIRSLFDK